MRKLRVLLRLCLMCEKTRLILGENVIYREARSYELYVIRVIVYLSFFIALCHPLDLRDLLKRKME